MIVQEYKCTPRLLQSLFVLEIHIISQWQEVGQCTLVGGVIDFSDGTSPLMSQLYVARISVEGGE